MKKISFIIPVLLTALIAGCGYATKSAMPSHMKSVYVEAFKNKIDFTSAQARNIYFPLLEVDVRNEIVKRYQFDGNLKINTLRNLIKNR